jgi:hypothetical protein
MITGVIDEYLHGADLGMAKLKLVKDGFILMQINYH